MIDQRSYKVEFPAYNQKLPNGVIHVPDRPGHDQSRDL